MDPEVQVYKKFHDGCSTSNTSSGGSDNHGQVAPAVSVSSTKQLFLVIGGFFALFNTWGLVLAYGSVQYYYAFFLLPNSSPSAISWIGTVQSALLILTGLPAGRLFDLGHFTIPTVIGAILSTLGVFMLSLVKQEAYWQVMLAEGIAIGLGSGLLYVPILAAVNQAFADSSANKKIVAMGIVTSGVGIGGVAYNLAFSRLITNHGFGPTVRVLGYMMLGVYAIAVPSLVYGSKRTPLMWAANLSMQPQRTPRPAFDPTALKDKPFLIFCFGSFCTFLAYLVPLFFSPSFATQVLHLDVHKAANILVISAGASTVGRLVSSALVAYSSSANSMNISIIAWGLCCLTATILDFAWISIRSASSFMAFTVLYGFATGGIISLPPSIFPSTCCPDKDMVGTRMGAAWGAIGIAFLIGGPIGGAIVGHGENSGWVGLAAFAGAFMAMGTLAVVVFGIVVRRSRI